MYDYQITCNRLIRFFPYLTLVHLIVSRLHRQIHRKTCVVYSSMAVYVTSKNSIWLQLYYRRQAKFAKVKVFTSVCPEGGGLHPGGGGACIQGVCIQRGVEQTPPYRILRDMVKERAVRILLECILVK